MEFKRALELMRIEKECVMRNATSSCDRDCAKCDLVQEDTDLIEAFQMAIFALEKLIENGKKDDGRNRITLKQLVDYLDCGEELELCFEDYGEWEDFVRAKAQSRIFKPYYDKVVWCLGIENGTIRVSIEEGQES